MRPLLITVIRHGKSDQWGHFVIAELLPRLAGKKNPKAGRRGAIN
jgi:hypothetical protein